MPTMVIGGLPFSWELQIWAFWNHIPNLFWWWKTKCQWFSSPNKVWYLEWDHAHLKFQVEGSPPFMICVQTYTGNWSILKWILSFCNELHSNWFWAEPELGWVLYTTKIRLTLLLSFGITWKLLFVVLFEKREEIMIHETETGIWNNINGSWWIGVLSPGDKNGLTLDSPDPQFVLSEKLTSLRWIATNISLCTTLNKCRTWLISRS
jgi:hypothetical protein